MNTVIILRGLPASGKSTWAREFITANPDCVRVNKDELRLQLLTGQPWSEAFEKKVIIPERNHRISEALSAGQDVIVDDTNFGDKHEKVIRQIADRFKADVQVRTFDTPVDECIRRDAQRTGTAHVGEAVIRRMHSQLIAGKEGPKIEAYQHQDGLPWAIISDLDGTLADADGIRNIYDVSKCDRDRLKEPVADIVKALFADNSVGRHSIIYVSGRDDIAEDLTEGWIERHGLPPGQLYMRKTGDRRNDAIVKQEIFDQHIRGKYNIKFVLDDRDRVVKYWRSIGLTCLQVNYGDF